MPSPSATLESNVKPPAHSTARTQLFARGAQQRKQLPRAALAHWDGSLRKKAPDRLLAGAAKGRLPALLKLKQQRMAESPFAFYRGALPVMAYDLSLQPHTQLFTQLCGDAHVQNFGAFAAPNGQVIFDLNDFDETIRGPFEWDVKRMATSILLAGDTARLRPRDALAAATLFLSAYTSMTREFAAMPILAAARFSVHRLRGVQPIAAVLLKAERETPLTSLDRLTVTSPHGRIFRSLPPRLRPLTSAQAAPVLKALKDYTATLLPERQHLLAKFRPVAVAFKVVGTGSIGMRDYCVYLEGNGPSDPLFLQIKQETASALSPYLPVPAHAPRNQGQRVTEGQRAMQFLSDPLLGFTRIQGRDYLVRQLNDHKASLDITTLTAAGLSAYAEICGELLARSHSRSGDPRIIAGYIGKGPRFSRAILEYAQSYAAQTLTDWKHFTASSSKSTRSRA